jgi:hypothetical protein
MNCLRCEKCGKFLPHKGYVTYTEYSDSTEFEPREPKFLHAECYLKSDTQLIDKTAWIKPHIVR